MAATNTGAKLVYNLAGRTSGILKIVRIYDSVTLTNGDFVKIDTNGFVALATAGARIFGVVTGIVDNVGTDIENTKQTTGATYTPSTQTVVCASDNSSRTTGYVQAVIDIDPFSVFSCEPDAAISITTSSGSSDQLGSYTDLLDEDGVDENNGGNAFNVVAQLFIWGVDPSDSTRGLYSIMESQFLGG